MKTNFLLGGLCAICMITFTVASVISCSGDDEYYDGGNYTLAKKRMTRGAPENGLYTLEKTEYETVNDSVSCRVDAKYSVSTYDKGHVSIQNVTGMGFDYYRLGPNSIYITNGKLANISYRLYLFKIRESPSSKDFVVYDTVNYYVDIKRKYSLSSFTWN